MIDSVPMIPESAPFTAEQRAYLNGFFAGLFSRANAVVTPPQQASIPLSILFGSQTGNAEALAKRAANEARKLGFAPAVHDLAGYAVDGLPSERRLLVITSTYGDGDPPDSAKPFWERIRNGTAPTVSDLRYAVLALGDSSYPKFCAFGKAVDERLEAMGGKRAHPRLDCDVDFETPFAQWIVTALQALSGSSNGASQLHVAPKSDEGGSTLNTPLSFGRSNPFPAPLIANRNLNAPGSSKDTRHLEFSLEGSGLKYEVGDALAVRPCNCPDLVDELIAALGCSPTDALNGVSVHHALLHDYEITRVPAALVKAAGERCGDKNLLQLAAADLNKFVHGMDVLDFIRRFPEAEFCAADVALLKKLPPRLYSISSSPKAHPGQVHLCVGIVRTEFGGRPRKGVCSTFLADRVEDGTTVPVFVHHNKNFRPPTDDSTPMIMVGPGTGIAPFRAFLEERRALGAKGKNWLLFGDQHAATDFLYRDEIETMLREGTLSKLDTAFSRDQAEKIYVQQRMAENAKELFAWLEEGAHFYVCGDASRMAKDVDRALHQVIETASDRTPEQAADYVRHLSASRRYQRDVY
jgi:sulfite reductase (NADPH) flavoprotein alpha-component